MPTGIGASLTSASPGTTIASATYNSNQNALNNAGISNDSGSISTNGSGVLTAVGLVAGNSGLTTNSTGLANLAAKIQSVSGDTSGTMSILETFTGSFKAVIIEQNNYRQNGAAQLITLNTAFTFMALIFNLGCGGIVQATSGSANQNNQVTWGTGTSAGTAASTTQITVNVAAYSFGGFTQVGSNGGYANSHTGIGIYIGV